MSLNFEHHFAENLPELTEPAPPPGFPNPELLILNRPLAAELGLQHLSDQELLEIFSGNEIASGSQPVALAYAGHQFGSFVPQLGDGRAVLLGERQDDQGRLLDLQLKGSGRTKFSRGGDGKATLGPILREYLVSEAMHHLGIPTTRVLVAMTTGELIQREGLLPGAVLARVAHSHLRIGTLEYLAVRGQDQQLARVVDYALRRHFDDLERSDCPALDLLQAVALGQARLIAKWMLVGFVHGVMNTDNMTLSGQTIDYGPCAFMDTYDPGTVFSSIDRGGRYAYGNQPTIGTWNLAMMGRALLPLLSTNQDEAVEKVRAVLSDYEREYETQFLSGMRQKLGLIDEQPDDPKLISGLLDWMAQTKQDFTMTFRRLANEWLAESGPQLDETAGSFLNHYKERLQGADVKAVAQRMKRHNPAYIPRNHRVEEVLRAAHGGDLEPFEKFLDVLSKPYDMRPEHAAYAEAPAQSEAPYRTFCGT
jgi:uncharacterized protein YdiU (UPF0061 family)